jgi:hypothetical protein
MATIDMTNNFGIELDDIDMTDEFGTEWIRKEYTYKCPSHNYLNGWDKTDTIKTVYLGPKTIYFYANNETGEFESVLRKHELPDDTMEPDEETTLIAFDCGSDPLAAEVICDYHNNFMDSNSYEHEVGSKSIESPEGYENFDYPYPIHPDELYDDLKCKWDFETKSIILHKNTSESVIGEAPTWKDIREHRLVLLANTDTQYDVMVKIDPDGDDTAEMKAYRQLLRDLPEAMQTAGIPRLYVDSMYPRTKLIDFGQVLADGDPGLEDDEDIKFP